MSASVTKDTCERYSVRNDCEWATIVLRCWDRRVNVGTSTESTYYCGEILIHSSFGNWAHTWLACGVPFKQFLIRAEFGYVFTKFMGAKLERFDGEATLAQIRRDIIEERRSGGMDKDEAREAWDCVSDEDERITSNDQTAYGYAMWDIGSRLDRSHPMRDYFNDPSGWPLCTHDDYQAVGFWRELWPAFVDALRGEIEEAAQERRAA